MKITTFVVATFILGSVYATEQSLEPKPVPKVKIENVKGDQFAGITLTKDQKKEIVKLMKAERKELKTQMKKLLKVAKVDKSKHHEIRNEIETFKAKTLKSIKALLTTEQLKVYEKNQKAIENDLFMLEENPKAIDTQ